MFTTISEMLAGFESIAKSLPLEGTQALLKGGGELIQRVASDYGVSPDKIDENEKLIPHPYNPDTKQGG